MPQKNSSQLPNSAAQVIDQRIRELGDSKTAAKIRFSATLFRPVATEKAVDWTFLRLPKEASAKLPSRGMTSSACDMLAKGKRRPCCFDRSGMYAKSLSCPVADDTSSDTRCERD